MPSPTTGVQKSNNSLPEQISTVIKTAITWWLAGIVFVLSSLYLAHLGDVPLGHLLRDTTAVLNAPVYIGLISNVNSLIWCASAAVCFFAFAALKARRQKALQRFILASALIGTIFLIDDFFRFHEEVFPKYLGIEEKVVMAAIGLSVAVYLLIYSRFLLKLEYLLLGAAFAFIGFSVVIDLLPFKIPFRYVIEDGSKFLGAITWLLFVARFCMFELIEHRYSGRNRTLKSTD